MLPHPRRRRQLRSLVVVLSSVLVAFAAGASPTFPGELRDVLAMDCRPPCTICHRTLDGGFATVNKDFGRAMGTLGGLEAQRPDLVAPAVAALMDSRSDVDGDGVLDVDEVRNLTDPNAVGGTLECLPEEDASGGGCAVVRRSDAGATSVLVLTALLAWTRRRVRLPR